MTLQQLRYIVAIAEAGTFSGAAKNLFITQPRVLPKRSSRNCSRSSRDWVFRWLAPRAWSRAHSSIRDVPSQYRASRVTRVAAPKRPRDRVIQNFRL